MALGRGTALPLVPVVIAYATLYATTSRWRGLMKEPVCPFSGPRHGQGSVSVPTQTSLPGFDKSGPTEDGSDGGLIVPSHRNLNLCTPWAASLGRFPFAAPFSQKCKAKYI